MENKMNEESEKRKEKYTQIVVTHETKKMIQDISKQTFRSMSGEVTFLVNQAHKQLKHGE